MKKMLKDMIINWHEKGYNITEITPLLPQCNPQEIKLIINEYEKAKKANA